MDLYILENRHAKRVDIIEWNEWKNAHDADCLVARNYVCGMTVETRFRGYDTKGYIHLFFVKVTGSAAWAERSRNENWEATTWEKAEEYHERMCGDIVTAYNIHLREQAHKEHHRQTR